MKQCLPILLVLQLLVTASGAADQEPQQEETFVGSGGKPGVCSEACYQVATCNEEVGGRCDCPKHLTGTDCYRNTSASQLAGYTQLPHKEAWDPMPCLNNCTQRGRCILGACVCTRGNFTSDCSVSLDPANKPVLLAGSGYTPRERRPRIYVYDIPHKYSSWHNPLRLDRGLHWVFWERLLGSGVVVGDGEEADWYYVPIKLRSTSDGYRLLEALFHVRQNWPWYDRLQGHRHFVLHGGDTGRGEVPGHVRDATANMTWLHHWGLTVDWDTSGWKAAHRPGKDVIVPIYFGARQGQGLIPVSGLHPRALKLPRTQTLLFAGRICGDHSEPNKTKEWPHCATTRSPGYSQGVRQMVHYHHHNRTGYKVVTGDEHYPLDLLNYKWCLAPSGGGHGHRQVLVSIMGCLPLVISDSVMQPFEPEMDWNRFGMRVAHTDIPRLHELLEAVDEPALDRLRVSLRCAAQHMIYSSIGGAFMQEDGRWDAFEFIMEILRMQQTYPGLDPKQYVEKDAEFRSFVNCGEPDMVTYGRKLIKAQRKKYPKLTHVGPDGNELTWETLYQTGLNDLTHKHSKTPDMASKKAPLPLCSTSLWDEAKSRCRISKSAIAVFAPGGAACEDYGDDLSKCPRVWP